MKRHQFPAVIFAGIIALGSCGKHEDEIGPGSDQTSKPRTIGVTSMSRSNPFYKAIQEGMEEEATTHDYEIIYLSCDNDVSEQQKQIKNLIAQNVAAIALTPSDSQTIGTSVKEANAAGIPVITFIDNVHYLGAKIVSHIGIDNAQGGELAGHAMIEALGRYGGKVVIIDHRAVESYARRVHGFKQVIEAHNQSVDAIGRIELIDELPGGGDRDQGFRAAEDALETEPGLNGIFAINDPSGLGAVDALKAADKLDQVTVVTFDGSPAGLQAIERGEIYAAPIQDPERIGRETIQAIITHLSGGKVEANIIIPTTLYKNADAGKETSQP